jgi:hypothetical protein
MKHKIIVAIAIISPFILIFIMGLIDYYEVYIDVDKLDYIPSSYINMTSQQLNEFPHLVLVLEQGEGWIKPPRDEWERLHDFFDNYEEWIIEYKDSYYEIGFSCA